MFTLVVLGIGLQGVPDPLVKNVFLLVRLDHQKYSVRQDAQKELFGKMDFPLYRALCKSKFANPEIGRRVTRVLKDWKDKITSGYQVSLQGYPDYPWMTPKTLSGGLYIEQARERGFVHGASPDYPCHREATRMWCQDQLEAVIENSFWQCKSERDFNKRVTKGIGQIEYQIRVLINSEQQYWMEVNMPNPLRKQQR